MLEVNKSHSKLFTSGPMELSNVTLVSNDDEADEAHEVMLMHLQELWHLLERTERRIKMMLDLCEEQMVGG